jgi:hypothetical protein
MVSRVCKVSPGSVLQSVNDAYAIPDAHIPRLDHLLEDSPCIERSNSETRR